MMPQDNVELYRGNLIQHGNHNDRIYLIKLAPKNFSTFPRELIEIAKKNGYSKIFAKVPEYEINPFLDAGFEEEARVPRFYNGKTTAVFIAFYLKEMRSLEPNSDRMDKIFRISLDKHISGRESYIENDLILRMCNESDVVSMADIYRKVFSSYPFPIHNADYIRETMNSHIDYFGFEADGQFVALSSAEVDEESSNVELTDFATLPTWRGKGLAQHLIIRMEQVMKNKGIRTSYTIARAMSIGMNVILSKSGYQFGGRLKNNTNISGKIESMNVWYKNLFTPEVSSVKINKELIRK